MPESPVQSRARQWARGARDRLVGQSADERGLKQRVADLEDEMQEARRLNRRLAELMDIVEELLVPLSQRDEEKVRRYLDSHTTVL